MFIGDYHTHTKYSDGKGSVLDNALAAREKGLREVAITDHGFNIPTMSFKKYLSAKADCLRAEDEVGIRVISGVEADVISLDGLVDVKDEEIEKIDYLTIGFHKFAFFKGLEDFFKMYAVTYFNEMIPTSEKAKAQNTRALIAAIERYPVKVITHINHSLKVHVPEVLAACAKKAVLVELNAKHLSDLEGHWRELIGSDATFILNSDAHRPADVGALDEAFETALARGIPAERIVNYCGE